MTGFEGYEGLSKKLETFSKMADIVERDLGPSISEYMRLVAVDLITGQDAVHHGRLRDSLTTKDAEFVLRTSETTVECGIETAVTYAPFIEYGTGPAGDPEVPHTNKTSWVYRTEDGKFYTAYPQKARPFMRPALRDGKVFADKLITGKIREVFD